MAHSAKTKLARRFARGINKTMTGASKKFGRMRKGADLAGKVSDHGYENALLGGGLAGVGLGAASREKQRRKLMKQGVRFSGEHYEDLVEFSMQPGIDPNLVQSLLDEASRIEQEGQTKIVISRQLYEQVQAALQQFTMQKQQIDGASVQRIQQQGFSAGYDLIKFSEQELVIQQKKKKSGMFGKVAKAAMMGGIAYGGLKLLKKRRNRKLQGTKF